MATPILSARHTLYTGTDEQLDAYDMCATVVVTNASAATLDIPDDSVVDFPLGTTVIVVQGGAGAVTVTADGDATVTGTTLVTATAGDQVYLVKYAANKWGAQVGT